MLSALQFAKLGVRVTSVNVASPAPLILHWASVMETSSRAEPIVIVSRLVLSVPILIVFPASPVPRLMVFIPVSPVARFIVSASVSLPMFIVPVVPLFRVRAFVVSDSIVNAPESTMLLVVKV